VQSSSQIITTNKPTSSLFYRAGWRQYPLFYTKVVSLVPPYFFLRLSLSAVQRCPCMGVPVILHEIQWFCCILNSICDPNKDLIWFDPTCRKTDCTSIVENRSKWLVKMWWLPKICGPCSAKMSEHSCEQHAVMCQCHSSDIDKVFAEIEAKFAK